MNKPESEEMARAASRLTRLIGKLAEGLTLDEAIAQLTLEAEVNSDDENSD